MAEVLITLGIIGVVAAITLPVLINKYQHTVLKNRAKKAYSTIYQAYYKSLADLEFSNNCLYEAGGAYTADCIQLKEQLLKNLKVIKYCKKGYEEGCIIAYRGNDDVIKDRYKDSDISEDELNEKIDYFKKNCGYTSAEIKNYSAFILSDGLTVILRNPAYFAIDTNGPQGPNKWGYDLFIIYAFFPDMKNFYLRADGRGCSITEKGGSTLFKMLQE